MSSYLRNELKNSSTLNGVNYVKYNQKHLEKRRANNIDFNSYNNTKDNSAILKRVIKKRYKDNLKKNSINYINTNVNIKYLYNYNNNNNNNYDYDNNNDYNNYKNNYIKYNYTNGNYDYSSASKKDDSDSNYKYINNINTNYRENNNNNVNTNDIDVQNFINNVRKKTINLKNFISPKSNFNEDNNNYDEFLINYYEGIDDNDYKMRYLLTKQNTYHIPYRYEKNKETRFINYNGNDNYNNNIHEIYEEINEIGGEPGDKEYKNSNHNDYVEDYNILYKKRKIKDLIINNNNYYLESRIGKELNSDMKNKRHINFNNIEDNNNLYYRNILTNNNNNKESIKNLNEIFKRNIYRAHVNYSCGNPEEYENKAIQFFTHLYQYFTMYYMNVVQKLFNFLKSHKNKKKDTNKKTIDSKVPLYKKNPQINIITNFRGETTKPENKIKANKKMFEISTLSKTETSFFRPIIKENRVPYHKGNILIDRIKSKNESVSPDKSSRCEMYRNINEMNKKYEDIHKRKNRMSLNNIKLGNDLSFASENISLCRNPSENKFKEIFENNLNKERERKKKVENLKKKKEEIEKSKLKNDILIIDVIN